MSNPFMEKAPFNAVPPTWNNVELGKLAKFENGDRSSNYPSQHEIIDDGIPFINAGDLAGSSITKKNLKYISEEVFNRLSSGKTQIGDILYCLRGTLGKFGLVENIEKGAIASSLVIVRPSDKDNLNFLLQYFSSEIAKRLLDEFNNGSAQPNLSATDLKRFVVPLPPQEEKAKISSILSSVDRVIDLTETEIEKLKNLKKGMMQDLLTKGIGHTKFKDSPVGRIPESWECKTIRDVAKVVDSLHKTPTFSQDGFYMVRVTDITEGELDFSQALKVSESVFKEFASKYSPRRGDVLMTRVGSVGRSCFVNTDTPFCIGQNTVVITPKVNNKYFYYYLNSEQIWNQILNETNGSSQGSLSLKSINKLVIAIPPQEEAVSIILALSHTDTNLMNKTDKLKKLKDLKKGLMQDLLTGTVRVNV